MSVSQPTLEDIYLELTGVAAEPTPRWRRRPHEHPDRSRQLDAGAETSAWSCWQIRYEQRAYWRNRGRGVFTFVFPMMFLVIFASLDKAATSPSLGGIPYNDFFVPGILAYGVIMTTFINLAIGTAILRDAGVLKRMQGTPLPRWAYTAARIGSAPDRGRC